MKFKDHSELEGLHAFLSASKYHWINYDQEKLQDTYTKWLAVQRGTELHDFAARCIKLGIKLSHSKQTINIYVNDAIGFKMTPEQPLYYSPNCFGTADAISFRNNLLRIHDLKTGVSPTSMHQLEIYASLFCLEYNINPKDIKIELRIYQTGEINIYEPDPDDITKIMEKIVQFDRCIEELKEDVDGE